MIMGCAWSILVWINSQEHSSFIIVVLYVQELRSKYLQRRKKSNLKSKL